MKKKKLVLLVGVPGTGKTELAVRLSVKGLCHRVALPGFFTVGSKQDPVSQSIVISKETFHVATILYKMNEYLCSVVETHSPLIFSDVIRPSHIIILRTNPLILFERLRNRGWGFAKILDNVEAEYLGMPLFETIQAFGRQVATENILELDTTNLSIEEAVSHVSEFIFGFTKGKTMKIDWTLSEIARDVESLLLKYRPYL